MWQAGYVTPEMALELLLDPLQVGTRKGCAALGAALPGWALRGQEARTTALISRRPQEVVVRTSL